MSRRTLLLISCVLLFLGLSTSVLLCNRPPHTAATKLEVAIHGDKVFRRQVTASLSLLSDLDPDALILIQRNVGEIRQADRSGMLAYRHPPVMEVGARTAGYSVSWLAGCIAHDAMHSKLYHDHKSAHHGPVPDEVWVGPQAETICLRYQLDVLVKLGASAWEIEHVAGLDPSSYIDPNQDGVIDETDYLQRDW